MMLARFKKRSFFAKRTGISLDIGSRKIKMLELRRANNCLHLLKYGSISTPAGAVEAGCILEPESLGKEVGELSARLGFKGKWLVSVVSGPQVYIRNIIMPSMKRSELKKAVLFQATSFLPIPVDEAAIDLFPLRDFEDKEGKKTEVFFVAVRRLQVENLELLCQIAGLKLAAVEIEPLAIRRLHISESGCIEAFLNLGASRSCFSVFRDETLLFHRALPFSCASFYHAVNFVGGDNYAGVGLIELGQDSQYDYLIRDLIAELSLSIEYYNMQHPGEAVEKIMLCGGGTRLRGLDRNLTEVLGYQMELMDPFARIILPDNIAESAAEELGYDFPVAIGLAARDLL